MVQSAVRPGRRTVLRALGLAGIGALTRQSTQPATAQSAARVPILAYHNIDYSGSQYATTPEMLDAQCVWLSTNGYATISVYQLWNAISAGAPLPANPVMLCNDDGWPGTTTFASTLSAHGMVGNYFINNYSPLSASELQLLAQNGPVQAHTANHQMMSHLDPATQVAEIADNQAYLSGITGQSVQFLAWPFGDFNVSALQAARDCGILAAFGLGGVACHVGQGDTLALPRIMMEATDSLETFASKVSHW